MSSDQENLQASPAPTTPPLIQTKPSDTPDAAAIQPPENDEPEEQCNCKTTMMSTDPEVAVLTQASPAPPTPLPIKTKPSQTAAGNQTPEIENGEVEDEECKTPTAPENRIPVLLTCPPAPRKRISGKRRKISGPDVYFEDDNREEVESFFASSYESLGFKICSALKRKLSQLRCA